MKEREREEPTLFEWMPWQRKNKRFILLSLGEMCENELESDPIRVCSGQGGKSWLVAVVSQPQLERCIMFFSLS